MTATTAGSRIRTAVAGSALLAVLAAAPGAYGTFASADSRNPASESPASGKTYVNPVSRGFADTFADPAVVRGKDGYWYAFGTTDPLRSGGKPHSLPVARSRDLVEWKYVTDALGKDNAPGWAAEDAAYWAPDITYHDGRYWLYFVVTQTDATDEKDDSAIGVATASSPAGPWKTHGEPVVPPRRGDNGFKWTFDPAHVTDTDGRRYLYYGSYNGGIEVTALSPDGTRRAGRPTLVATDNRFEGAYVIRRGGWWYLFASSGDCCAGPTTGYSVFAGRSRSVRGPFTDRDGVPLTASRTGGSITLTPNGNRWVGTGHNAVVTDLAGQDWMLYHAIDRSNPYLDKPYGINRRPMLIDRLDWKNGWPVVRGGKGASAGRQPAPVTSPRTKAQKRPAVPAGGDSRPPGDPGSLDPARSDEFDGERPRPGWQWVRHPAGSVRDGQYVWRTQDAELHKKTNTASVMLRQAPRGDFTVETKLSIDLGVETVRNYQQAGLVAYAYDDRYLRLAHTAIWNTRQTEYGKEQPYAGDIAYGSASVGPPARTTWLRLRHTTSHGEHHVQALTSRDGTQWTAGGTWTIPGKHRLRYGLVSLGGDGATAKFDYYRLYRH
ncbi:family 43 glycosylhydrolase [Streptomyces marispadix]|uniref:Family 43 glycosylhydrolase n=1 Tax=Streptomyces marispadix TaxID=2922868 RepID=A0ABS9SRG1_9ACTN|nr:family 43 glycosylhydrolase [Streptomyces marispadix]MCH6158869.1 family 43 glycosylhydrolase [Streptomyces marispadix]